MWLRDGARVVAPGLLVGIGLCLIVLLGSTAWWLRRPYPILMSLAFAGAFGWSLKHPPTLVERIAILGGTAVTEPARRYMRRVTLMWCGFSRSMRRLRLDGGRGRPCRVAL
jgi:uncharacterized membrane protein